MEVDNKSHVYSIKVQTTVKCDMFENNILINDVVWKITKT